MCSTAYTLTDISVNMEVKFPCTMYLQEAGKQQKLSSPVSHHNHTFSVEENIELDVTGKQFQISVMIWTKRGNCYQYGCVVLHREELETRENLSKPLLNCFDQNAQFICKVIKRSQNSGGILQSQNLNPIETQQSSCIQGQQSHSCSEQTQTIQQPTKQVTQLNTAITDLKLHHKKSNKFIKTHNSELTAITNSNQHQTTVICNNQHQQTTETTNNHPYKNDKLQHQFLQNQQQQQTKKIITQSIIKQLRHKITNFQLTNNLINKDKQMYMNNCQEYKTKIQQLNNTLQSNKQQLHKLQIQNMDLLASANSKDRLLKKLNDQIDNKIEYLSEQKTRLQQQLQQYKIVKQSLERQCVEYKEQIQHKDRQYTQMQQLYMNRIRECQQRIDKLKVYNEQFNGHVNNQQYDVKDQKYHAESMQRNNEMSEQLVSSTQKCEQLQIINQKQAALIKQLQYKYDKNVLETQLFGQTYKNQHRACLEKQKQLEAELIRRQDNRLQLNAQVGQYKQQGTKYEMIIAELRNKQSEASDNLNTLQYKLKKADQNLEIFSEQIQQKSQVIDELMQNQQSLIHQNRDTKQEKTKIEMQMCQFRQSMALHQKNDEIKQGQIRQLKAILQSNNTEIQRLRSVETLHESELQRHKEQLFEVQTQLKTAKRELSRNQQRLIKIVQDLFPIDQQLQKTVPKNSPRYRFLTRSQSFQSKMGGGSSPSVDPLNTLVSHHRRQVRQLKQCVLLLERQLLQCQTQHTQCKQRLTISQQQKQQKHEELEICSKTIHNYEQLLYTKQSQLANLQSDHNQLLTIHEQYIFSLNRYKIDKQQELCEHKNKNLQLQHSLLSSQQIMKELQDSHANQCNLLETNYKKMVSNLKERHMDQYEKLQKIKDQECEQHKLNMQKLIMQLSTVKQQSNYFQQCNKQKDMKIVDLNIELDSNKQIINKLLQSQQKHVKLNKQCMENIAQLEKQLKQSKYQVENISSQNTLLQQDNEKYKQKIRGKVQMSINWAIDKNKMQQQIRSLQNQLTKSQQTVQSLKLQKQSIQHSYQTQIATHTDKNQQLQQTNKLLQQQFSTQTEQFSQKYNNLLIEYEQLKNSHYQQTNGQQICEKCKQKFQQILEQLKSKEQLLYVYSGRANEVQIELENYRNKYAEVLLSGNCGEVGYCRDGGLSSCDSPIYSQLKDQESREEGLEAPNSLQFGEIEQQSYHQNDH